MIARQKAIEGFSAQEWLIKLGLLKDHLGDSRDIECSVIEKGMRAIWGRYDSHINYGR